MARHESAFNTDDPLLIEIGKIYRAWLDSDRTVDPLHDIQNAIAPHLSKPENAAKGLPTNIGFEQTPEQKRENGRRAIVDSSPTLDGAFDFDTHKPRDLTKRVQEIDRAIVDQVESNGMPPVESECHYDLYAEDTWRGKIPTDYYAE